jgi:hypothetical protein
MIIITSKREGFRRCGVTHSKGAVEYADGHWTEKQLKALKAEPMLVVTDTNATPASGKEPKGPASQVAMDDIVAAIGRLSIDNPELWSASSGKPHVKSVEESIGEGSAITAAQRDEAWEIFQKSHPVGE